MRIFAQNGFEFNTAPASVAWLCAIHRVLRWYMGKYKYRFAGITFGSVFQALFQKTEVLFAVTVGPGPAHTDCDERIPFDVDVLVKRLSQLEIVFV